MKKVPIDKGQVIETPWLSVGEAAVYCGMSRSNFNEIGKDIPFSGHGRDRKYKTAVLDEWMKNRK